jgi:hypothetical protein
MGSEPVRTQTQPLAGSDVSDPGQDRGIHDVLVDERVVLGQIALATKNRPIQMIPAIAAGRTAIPRIRAPPISRSDSK